MYTITKRIIYFNIFILLLSGLGAILQFQASYLSLFLQIALPILGLAFIIGNVIGLYYSLKFKQIIQNIHMSSFFVSDFWLDYISRMEFILGKNAVLEACKDVKVPLVVDVAKLYEMDDVVCLIQKSGLRFLELRKFGSRTIDYSWELLRDRLAERKININHLSFTVGSQNIENGAIKKIVESLRDINSPKKVSYIWGNNENFSNIKPALECLAQTNITSLGLWGERNAGYQGIECMLTMLSQIPENIKELDLSVNVSYLINEDTKIDGKEAQHIQKLVLNSNVLQHMTIQVLTKFLRLFPSLTEVKIVGDDGKPATSYNSNFISNLMEGRKKHQALQSNAVLKAAKGSKDTAGIIEGFMGLPVSAFASKSPAGGQPGVSPKGDQAGNVDEEKQGPGPGN